MAVMALLRLLSAFLCQGRDVPLIMMTYYILIQFSNVFNASKTAISHTTEMKL